MLAFKVLLVSCSFLLLQTSTATHLDTSPVKGEEATAGYSTGVQEGLSFPSQPAQVPVKSKYLRSASHSTFEKRGSTIRTSIGVGGWELSSYTEFFIRRNGKDYHHAARVSHVSSLPHPRSQHGRYGRYVDDNPVVHFFRNIVSPRTTPPMQAKGGETPKHGYGSGKYYEHKYAHKGHKGYHHDGQGTLSKLFRLGGSGSRPGSRSGSPIARR